MLQALEPYGEGHPRRWRGECVALGRWLMPSVPEDAFDRQPYAGRDGHVRVIADVRLDNRPELIDLLGIPHHEGSALADAELVARAWERWDEACLDRLVGDYALAVWDDTRRRLYLARDFVGSRPLFYHQGRGFIAFASMPSGIHALPGVPYEIDEDYFASAAMLTLGRDDRSFFKAICRVRPNELVTCSVNGLHRRAYWRPDAVKPLRLAGPAEYAEALRDALDRAVSSQLRGHGDVASQLSAGRDSSCVTATAAALLANGPRKVVAFTAAPRAGYAEAPRAGRLVDESVHAASVAARYDNVAHVVVRSGDRTPLDNLTGQAVVFQHPVFNLCNQVWIDAMLEAAQARGLRVMLTGWMGNATISFCDPLALRALAAEGAWLTLYRDAAALVAGGHAS